MMRNPDAVLGEMPYIIKKKIVENTGPLERISLRRISKQFKSIIERLGLDWYAVKICVTAGKVEIKITGAIESPQFVVSWAETESEKGTKTIHIHPTRGVREIIENDVDYIERAVAEIDSLLNYPDVTIQHFSINNLSCHDLTRDAFYEKLSRKFSVRTNKLNVKYFFMCVNDAPSTERFLDRLNPDTLECLKLPLIAGSHPSRDELTHLGQSRLFKNAKEVYVEEINGRLPIENWRDKAFVSIRVGAVPASFLVGLKTHLLSSPNFERFEVFHNFIDIAVMLNALGLRENIQRVRRPIGGNCKISITFGKVIFEREGYREGHRFNIA